MSCSTSFCSIQSESSSASGSTKATSRELLFGEIDSCTTQSLRSNTSICNLTLSTSSTFLKFWLLDEARNSFLSQVDGGDLAALRLVCHDFSNRVGPFLFKDVSVTFKPKTFTSPPRVAALERIGHHVRHLTFKVAHTKDTVLPPLIDPYTGEELAFVYEPQTHSPATLIDKVKHPKYGSWEMADLLIKQYPPLFHAATNVPSFFRAFSALPNLEHLRISCPGYDKSQRYRRSVVDYCLISLRIAVERASLEHLRTLSLSPIHEDGLLYLQPTFAFGASPKAAKRWAQIKDLSIQMQSCEAIETKTCNVLKILHAYLHNFRCLRKLNFRWAGGKGPCPLSLHSEPHLQGAGPRADGSDRPALRRLKFSQLQYMTLENAKMDAAQISAFITRHRRTLNEFAFEDIKLRSGNWDEALAPLVKMAAKRGPPTAEDEAMDVPLMLSPENWDEERIPLQSPTENGVGTRTRDRATLGRWLSKRRASKVTWKAKEQILGGSEQMRKFFRCSVMPWR